jgi:hypothetical protein
VESRDSRRALVPAALACVVVVLTCMAFAPALDFGFVDFDDLSLLVDNTRYQSISPDSLAWMFTTTYFGHYQPLTWLSFAIDHARTSNTAVDGMALARAMHATNILIHACNAVLVMVLLRALMRSPRRSTAREESDHRGRPDRRAWIVAAGAALLWSVHPLRVESVAWVTERRDVLSTFFLLCSTLAYLGAVRRVDAGRAPLIALPVALLAVSLLCKAWGMSLFVVLLVLDVCPLRRLPIEPWRWLRKENRGVLIEKIPFALLGIAAAVMAGAAQKSAAGAVRSLAEWPITSRVAQAAYGLVFYLWKSLVPTRLVVLVELPHNMNWLALRYVACAALVAAVAALAIGLRRRVPALACAIAAYAVLLLPVLGTFQSGDQLVADRYSYVAMIPIVALLAGGLWRLVDRCARVSNRAGAACTTAMFVLCIASTCVLIRMSRTQTLVWKDSIALWTHAVEFGPEGSATETNFAIMLERAGRIDEALAHDRRAVEIDPDNGRAWFLIGKILRARGDIAGARHALHEAARSMPQAYMAWVTLGNMLFHDLGKMDEGLAAYREGVRDLVTPRTGSAGTRQLSGVPYLALGTALKKTGDLAGARSAFESAMEYPDTKEIATQQIRALPPTK